MVPLPSAVRSLLASTLVSHFSRRVITGKWIVDTRYAGRSNCRCWTKGFIVGCGVSFLRHSDEICSAEKKGIHTAGIARISMIPFKSIPFTEAEAKKIIAHQRNHVESLLAQGNISEGLRAQYELVLQAYESGKSGSCELAAFPGFIIPGSECLLWVACCIV